jgi:hypothetical protein
VSEVGSGLMCCVEVGSLGGCLLLAARDFAFSHCCDGGERRGHVV